MNAFYIILIILFLITVISRYIIFEKADEHGWKSLIPVYGFAITCRITGKPAWWAILLLIPAANIIVVIRIMLLLSLCFGKKEGFAVGLLLLPFLFLPILAGSSYIGKAGIKTK